MKWTMLLLTLTNKSLFAANLIFCSIDIVFKSRTKKGGGEMC